MSLVENSRDSSSISSEWWVSFNCSYNFWLLFLDMYISTLCGSMIAQKSVIVIYVYFGLIQFCRVGSHGLYVLAAA